MYNIFASLHTRYVHLISPLFYSLGYYCSSGDIRLTNGRTLYEGRIEVCHNGVWGAICNDFWTQSNNNAKVACKQLGYSIQSEL